MLISFQLPLQMSVILIPSLFEISLGLSFQSNIQLLLDQDIHNNLYCQMPKLFIPSSLFISNLALETVVLSNEGLVENLLDIFLPNNQIRKPINKISKENKSKCLGSEPWCSYQFGWLKSQIR